MLHGKASEGIHISPFIKGIKDQIEDREIQDEKDES
jgi:hypothetical protein